MSLSDDQFDLEDHFKELVRTPDRISTANLRERKGLLEAFNRLMTAQADMERAAMRTQPVMEAVATILNAFRVQRLTKE